MKSETIKLQKLIKEVLREIGDLSKIEPYDLKDAYYGFNWEDKIKIGENISIEMSIMEIPHHYVVGFADKIPPVFNFNESTPILSIGYTINNEEGQYMKSDYKTLVKIMATMKKYVENFIKKNKKEITKRDPVFIIGSSDKYGDDKEDVQKTKLYRAIFNKQIHQLPFKLRTTEVKIANRTLLVFKII